MQDCFRLHPEIYGDEIADDEDEEAPAGEGASGVGDATTKTSSPEIDASSPASTAVDNKSIVETAAPGEQPPSVPAKTPEPEASKPETS